MIKDMIYFQSSMVLEKCMISFFITLFSYICCSSDIEYILTTIKNDNIRELRIKKSV